MVKKFFQSIIVMLVLMLIYNHLVSIFFKPASFLDELFLGLFFLIVAYNLMFNKRIDKYPLLLILCMLVFIFMSYIGNYYAGINQCIIGALIHLKWFIFIYILIFIFEDDYNKLNQCFKIVVIFSTIGLIANFILQTKFNSLLSQDFDMRDGRLRLIGFDMHPNNLALLMMLLYIYYNFFDGLPSYQRIVKSTLVFVPAIVIFVGTRTVLTFLPIVFLYLLFHKKDKKLSALMLSGMAMGVVFGLIFFGQSIIQNTQQNLDAIFKEQNKTEYLRGLMMYHGFKIMNDEFPIGTGLTTFGTVLSKHSKVYEDIDFRRMPVLVTMKGGLFDSNLASICGELGFIGVLVFIFLLYYVYKMCKVRMNNCNHNMHYINLILLSTLIVFNSVPLFMYAYTSTLYALFITLQIAKVKSLDENIIYK